MRQDLKLIKHDTMTRQLTFQIKPEEAYPLQASIIVLEFDNPFGTGKDGVVRYQNTFDPQHPEYLTIPKAQEIGNGKVFTVDSHKLGLSTSEQGYSTFKDGVINVDAYVGQQSISVTGVKDTNYLVGTNLTEIATSFDAVIVGTDVYKIDKSKPTNAGTVLYLFEDLKSDVTSVTVAYRSNLKLYNNFRTKCLIGKSAHILTNDYSTHYDILEKERGVLKVIRNDIASRICFEQEDYEKAERLLKENIQIGLRLGILKSNGELW